MRTSKQSRASKKTEERQDTENLKHMQMAKSKEERVNSNATRCKQPRKKKKGPESTGGEEEVSSGSRCTPCTALCGSRHSNCLPLFLTYFFTLLFIKVWWIKRITVFPVHRVIVIFQ